MSLHYIYFKNKTHIEDLQKLKDDKLYPIIQEFKKELEKLKDDKLYPIIQEFKKELEKLNNIKTTQLKDLKKLCDETANIIKNIGFILNDYKNVYQKDYYNDKEREAIDDILYEMDKINFFIKDLKTLKINSLKVNKLVNDLLIFIRLLNLTISGLNNN